MKYTLCQSIEYTNITYFRIFNTSGTLSSWTIFGTDYLDKTKDWRSRFDLPREAHPKAELFNPRVFTQIMTGTKKQINDKLVELLTTQIAVEVLKR